jgi:hypothetical protein
MVSHRPTRTPRRGGERLAFRGPNQIAWTMPTPAVVPRSCCSRIYGITSPPRWYRRWQNRAVPIWFCRSDKLERERPKVPLSFRFRHPNFLRREGEKGTGANPNLTIWNRRPLQGSRSAPLIGRCWVNQRFGGFVPSNSFFAAEQKLQIKS